MHRAGVPQGATCCDVLQFVKDPVEDAVVQTDNALIGDIF